MTENAGQNDLLAELTADVVSAYVSNNPVQAADLPGLISEIHVALGKTLGGVVEEVQEKPRPAVNPKRSVTDDYIICLEDGQKFKSLKRHLMSHYGMTPEEYREKWGLPADYPMVAPSYAAQRSKLAREMGLGRKRGK
ncbi:MucR family transcriptional regulator [Oricola sp.]|uniref:MucR family transcriptional regulator n=1 Tax=Oricola sp. TaxID=1979950 RepID=UPI0025E299FC|nr:MucR family transcriptional regulator [Oricola sp.]MCI5073539.1 MucR family transcriptional regulator [Oricola sp.]